MGDLLLKWLARKDKSRQGRDPTTLVEVLEDQKFKNTHQNSNTYSTVFEELCSSKIDNEDIQKQKFEN